MKNLKFHGKPARKPRAFRPGYLTSLCFGPEWGEIDKDNCTYWRKPYVDDFNKKHFDLLCKIHFTKGDRFYCRITYNGFVCNENTGGVKFRPSNPYKIAKIIAEKFKP